MTKTVSINSRDWIVEAVVPIDEFMGGRSRLLERAIAAGIRRVLYVRRPQGRKVYPMYQWANGRVESV